MQKSKRLHALKNQVARTERKLAALKAESNRFSRRRFVVFLSGIGLGVASYYLVTGWFGWSVMALTLVVFNIIAFFHRRVLRSIEKYEIWLNIKSAQLARMQLDWDKIPMPPQKETQQIHPFGIDLDITGRHSLHQLIDSAVSRDGSELLQEWLLEVNPKAQTIQKRQRLVKELTPMARFRDKLLLAFALVSKEQLEGKKLLNFLKSQSSKSFTRVLIASAALAGLNLILFALNQFGFIPAYWIVSLTIYVAVYLMNQNLLEALLDDAVLISEELKKLQAISKYLETYSYGKNRHLRKHCQLFLDANNRPSTQVKRITIIAAAVGLRMNPLFRVFLNVIVPWDFFVARRLEELKTQFGDNLENWLNVLFELEALASLANFAYLNPHCVFPEISSAKKAPFIFSAKKIGHPLIPDRQKKTNDFSLNGLGEIALITGSNMSGKSTFLKTVGINLCLAFAGGPVDAKHLKTSLFRIYTCIKINDSVTDGFSFFYAEVKRLKVLLNQLEMSKGLPVLFLIDEIFKGTNNRERLIGSRSYIETLADKNGLGIVTTHDLELTNLADKIQEVKNYHFREEVVDGKMVFDYKMRPGPCPSTNALKIMQMEGLPIEA
ncbi:hypothetical protein IH785_16715 [candidate division KSB1 bacterium]|nr:hypothetical protein [candidate division KSB1 bacterium]